MMVTLGKIVTELTKLNEKVDKLDKFVEIFNPEVKWMGSLFICELFYCIAPQLPGWCLQG